MPIYSRPTPAEYAEYYSLYVDRVPIGDVLKTLAVQKYATRAVLEGLNESQAGQRYAPGKWSIAELVAHLIDTERLFTYRALSFARRDPAPLPGMEPDDWSAASNANGRTLSELGHEYDAVRSASLALFAGFTAEAIARRGVASGCEFTVRAIPFILAGHELHHLSVLQERYL